jgi:hypothetical protein
MGPIFVQGLHQVRLADIGAQVPLVARRVAIEVTDFDLAGRAYPYHDHLQLP